MPRDDVDPELVAVINRRFDVLSALTGNRDKRDLVEELDISRSTINRAVRQLESLGLVTRGDGYRQTVAGRLVADVYEGFTGELGDVMAVEELLQSLPPAAPMSTAMLRDATVERSSGPTPTQPLDGVVEVMSTTDRFRSLVPRISRPDLLRTFDEDLVQAGVPTEAVFSEGLSEYLRTERPAVYERFLSAPNCSVYVHEDIPYALGLSELPDRVDTSIVVYDPEGGLKGVVSSDGREAYDWGEGVFERFRAEAEALAAPELER